VVRRLSWILKLMRASSLPIANMRAIIAIFTAKECFTPLCDRDGHTVELMSRERSRLIPSRSSSE
jgi:hypothetical protein